MGYLVLVDKSVGRWFWHLPWQRVGQIKKKLPRAAKMLFRQNNMFNFFLEKVLNSLQLKGAGEKKKDKSYACLSVSFNTQRLQVFSSLQRHTCP